MRHKITGLVFLGLLFVATTIVGQQAKQAGIDLQTAIRTETVKGDLKAAIKQYETIAARYTTDRAIVAQALVHMADCYRMLGDSESQKIYERIVRDFADQKQALAVATAHLGGGTSVGKTSRQVWNADTYGSVSPDGRYLSFMAPFRGISVDNVAPGALGVRDLRNGTNREIVRFNSGDEGDESVISKDGKLIAYTAFSAKDRRYRLHLANVENEPNPRLLFDNPDVDWLAAYDWSPDDRSLVVLLQRKDRTAQIGFVSVPDGSLRILESVDWRGTGRIFFSPDGKYVGYDLPASDTTREHDVFVLSADGSHKITAVSHPSLNFMMGWSADGKWLLFSSNRTGARSLWAVPFEEGKVQGSPELVRADIGQVESMGVTRSGSFYFGVKSGNRSTTTINIAHIEPGTSRVQSTTSIPKEPIASDSQPMWSPDGKFLAYLSDRGISGSTVEQNGLRNLVLVIRSTETNQGVRDFDLNLSRGNALIKSWTSDGSAVLVSGVDSKWRPGLFHVDARSGEMSTVGFVELKGEWADGNWKVSSDAKTIFSITPDCDANCKSVAIYRRDLTTAVQTELVRASRLGAVNLSPNDEYIATNIQDTKTNSPIFSVIPTKSGHPQELMRVAAGNLDGGFNFMAWAPDSRSVYLREMANGKPVAVWRAALDGTAPEKLNWDVNQMATGHIAIHPNGTSVAYAPAPQRDQSVSEIWVLENFLPSAKPSK